MNCFIMLISAGLIFACFSYLACGYRHYCNSEEKDKKLLLRPPLDKSAWLAVGLWAVSSALFAKSLLLGHENFLQSLINGETALWLGLAALIDAKKRIIPNHLIVFEAGWWLVTAVLQVVVLHSGIRNMLVFSGLGFVLCGGAFLVIALLLRSALGMGDVKMVAVLGLLYGVFDTYSTILLAMILMAVIALVLLAAKKVTRKSRMPMAPFMFAAFVINVILGM